MRILRSEWLKVVSVPTTWILLGTMLLIEGLFAGLRRGPRRHRGPARRADPRDAADRHAAVDGPDLHARRAAGDQRVPPRDGEPDVHDHAAARARDRRQARRRARRRDRRRRCCTSPSTPASACRSCPSRGVDGRRRPGRQHLPRRRRRDRARLPVRRRARRAAAKPDPDDRGRPRAVLSCAASSRCSSARTSASTSPARRCSRCRARPTRRGRCSSQVDAGLVLRRDVRRARDRGRLRDALPRDQLRV